MGKIKSLRAAMPNVRLLVFPLCWAGPLVVWFIALCLFPDPRPLGAPQWAIMGMQKLLGTSEPAARTVAAVLLRGIEAAGLGVLLVQVFIRLENRWAGLAPLGIAPLLALSGMWINYGYFPIDQQIWIGVTGALLGVLAGLAVRRNRKALIALVVSVAGIFMWGTATSISDDLNNDAGATGLYVLQKADTIPDGDAGFEQLMKIAFSYAADNSRRRNAAHANRAAILALGTILGEEKVAEVARRSIDLSRLSEVQALRHRITLYGRNDLSRHFWVSAALTVLSDETRSITVGLTKELMDANGGSGFSFVDLTADRAGTLFTLAAARNARSARALQETIRNGARITDFMPNVLDLPEGISRDDFHALYGGLGGEETGRIVKDIEARLNQCPGLAR